MDKRTRPKSARMKICISIPLPQVEVIEEVALEQGECRAQTLTRMIGEHLREKYAEKMRKANPAANRNAVYGKAQEPAP